MPSSSEITVVLGAESEATEVSGTIYFYYYEEDTRRWIASERNDITVKDNETQLCYFATVESPAYALYFMPYSPMYMNYLAIYQGHWTADELDLISSPSSQASRRAVSTGSYESTTNSYTFTNLDAGKLYSYRLRAFGDGGEYSGWSVFKPLSFGTTDIQSITTKVHSDNSVRYFDLQGRAVPADTKGLLIRKQGSVVKKVIVK